MKKLLFSISLIAFLGIFSGKAFADCQELYGGGTSCTSHNFTINKLVQSPTKGGELVENLSVNDPKFAPAQTINYRLIVKNNGSDNIPTLNIKDVFPQYITFVAGPGTYDSNTNTLTFTISNLGSGQSKTYDLTAKTASLNNLPSDQNVTCVINQAYATDNNGVTNSDNAQACIQKPGKKLETLPATGPEMLPLAFLFPGALGGLILRKKSNKVDFEGGEK
jgi:uncharacterized repeat protein (TIGR01451 family)